MLEGRLSEFSLADIFALLALTRKSGSLRLRTAASQGRIDFRGGEVGFATSDARRLQFGARLVSAGVVGEEHLDRVRTAEREPGRLAAELVDGGVLDADTLDRLTREQIDDAVFTLMRAADGAFSFHPADDGDPGQGPTVPTDELVERSAHRLEQWATIRERIPSQEAVLALAPNPPAADGRVTLSVEQWRVLALVDGARTVADLVDLTGQGEYATCTVLAGLVDAHLLEACDPAAGGSTAVATILARRDALRRLDDAAPTDPAAGNGSRTADATADAPEASPFTGGVVPAARPGDELVDAEPSIRPPAPFTPPARRPAPAFLQAAPAPDLPAPADDARPAAGGPSAGEDEETAGVDPAPAPDEEANPAGQDRPVPSGGEVPPEGVGAGALGPAAIEGPPPGGPATPRPAVDRAQVARELASLGLDEDPVTPSPRTPPPSPSTPPADRRLTRDEDVTKGLLVRLMDGVKKA